MKQAKDEPRSAPQPASDDDAADDSRKPPLPHESDQVAASQQESEPRGVGRQAHEDIERGLVDTDRRSGQPDGQPDSQPAPKP